MCVIGEGKCCKIMLEWHVSEKAAWSTRRLVVFQAERANLDVGKVGKER